MRAAGRDPGVAPTAVRGAMVVSLALVLSLSLLAHAAPPPADPDLGAQVRVAFLFNFAKFTTWPSADAITFCVVGGEPLGGPLEQAIRDRSIDGHPCRFERITTAEQARRCQVLYLDGGDAGAIAEAVRRLPVLTVGNGTAFIESEGLIGFEMEGNRMRFAINETAAHEAGLKLSAKLLGLAKVVR